MSFQAHPDLMAPVEIAFRGRLAGRVTFLYELCELLSGRIFSSDVGFELGREEIGYEMGGLAIHIGILEIEGL